MTTLALLLKKKRCWETLLTFRLAFTLYVFWLCCPSNNKSIDAVVWFTDHVNAMNLLILGKRNFKKNVASTRKVLNSRVCVPELKREIQKTNIKGYSKLKKGGLVSLMAKKIHKKEIQSHDIHDQTEIAGRQRSQLPP